MAKKPDIAKIFIDQWSIGDYGAIRIDLRNHLLITSINKSESYPNGGYVVMDRDSMTLITDSKQIHCSPSCLESINVPTEADRNFLTETDKIILRDFFSTHDNLDVMINLFRSSNKFIDRIIDGTSPAFYIINPCGQSSLSGIRINFAYEKYAIGYGLLWVAIGPSGVMIGIRLDAESRVIVPSDYGKSLDFESIKDIHEGSYISNLKDELNKKLYKRQYSRISDLQNGDILFYDSSNRLEPESRLLYHTIFKANGL